MTAVRVASEGGEGGDGGESGCVKILSYSSQSLPAHRSFIFEIAQTIAEIILYGVPTVV